uniref:Uncharacterized protein n=1 Tax=Parascaris univalens TaxID=6257 RepID=A0A915BFK3_PARUN
MASQRSAINYYYSVKNSYGAVDISNKYIKHVRTVLTAAFFTLFTALPYDGIIKAMEFITLIYFENSKKAYLKVCDSRALFTSSLG